MFKKLAVALDGSTCAEQAFEVALRLAESERAEIGICSVVDPTTVVGTTLPPGATHLALVEMECSSKEFIAIAVGRARKREILATGETRHGAAPSEILKYAKDFGADAIVIGTHGRSGLKRLFMGSVAEAVLREALVPVIIVREREQIRAHS